LSGQNVLGFLTAVAPRYPQNEELSALVKFVASAEGRTMAELLADTLRALGYNVMRNEEGDYVFPSDKGILSCLRLLGSEVRLIPPARRQTKGELQGT